MMVTSLVFLVLILEPSKAEGQYKYSMRREKHGYVAKGAKYPEQQNSHLSLSHLFPRALCWQRHLQLSLTCCHLPKSVPPIPAWWLFTSKHFLYLFGSQRDASEGDNWYPFPSFFKIWGNVSFLFHYSNCNTEWSGAVAITLEGKREKWIPSSTSAFLISAAGGAVIY